MFLSDLEVREHDPGRWVLLDDLIWDDGERRIVVPRGFVTDLASIPRIARGVFDQNGRSRRAAVLHDYTYAVPLMTRAEADALFRRALATLGVGPIARAFYWSAVRTGGWNVWQVRKSFIVDVPAKCGPEVNS